jgi:hypothetical protein
MPRLQRPAVDSEVRLQRNRHRRGPGQRRLALIAAAEIRRRVTPPGESPKHGKGRHLTVLPSLHIHLGLAPVPAFLVYVEADRAAASGDDYRELVAGLTWTLSRRWEIGLAYRQVDWSVSSRDLQNVFESELAAASVGYRW